MNVSKLIQLLKENGAGTVICLSRVKNILLSVKTDSKGYVLEVDGCQFPLEDYSILEQSLGPVVHEQETWYGELMVRYGLRLDDVVMKFNGKDVEFYVMTRNGATLAKVIQDESLELNHVIQGSGNHMKGCVDELKHNFGDDAVRLHALTTMLIHIDALGSKNVKDCVRGIREALDNGDVKYDNMCHVLIPLALTLDIGGMQELQESIGRALGSIHAQFRKKDMEIF